MVLDCPGDSGVGGNVWSWNRFVLEEKLTRAGLLFAVMDTRPAARQELEQLEAVDHARGILAHRQRGIERRGGHLDAPDSGRRFGKRVRPDAALSIELRTGQRDE